MPKFKAGTSGNKAGRPPGARDKRTELRELLRPHAAALFQKAVDLALGGDTAALKICLDRLAPALKPQGELVNLNIPATGTLTEKAEALFTAAASGKISADAALGLMSLLSGQARVSGSSDLERLEAIEALLHIKK